ncbi:unnamed protein product [Cuscuta europaea]|uniref:Uncharacterized protein n=1 Tax=Cuscuta europaea TaxID=41803 RepID=A0A9P1DZY2_CUSEU|nr:unnamed protein product [Cuscuta europaea]
MVVDGSKAGTGGLLQRLNSDGRAPASDGQGEQLIEKHIGKACLVINSAHQETKRRRTGATDWSRGARVWSRVLPTSKIIAKVRPPPEPPPWVVRCARVCESFPINFYYFVIWFLATVYVGRFVNLFGILAFFMSLGIFGSMGTETVVSTVKPGAWLAIHVALSGVTVSKSDHRVYNRSYCCLVGVRFFFFD